MNHARKQEVVAAANRRRGAISDDKGPEYAGSAVHYQDDDQDVLANFKRQDDRWGYDGSGISSAFLYFGKHLDSIETYARGVKPLLEAGDTYAAHDLGLKGEGILSRLDDARNYIDLIECLLIDAVIHPDTTPVYMNAGWPSPETESLPFEPRTFEGAWEVALAPPKGYKVSSKPGVFIAEGYNEYLQEPSEVGPCEGNDPCECKADGAIHAFEEAGPDYGVDYKTGEKLYKIAEFGEFYLTLSEADALRRHDVRPVRYGYPRTGEDYLLMFSDGSSQRLTAGGEHTPGVDNQQVIVRNLDAWERTF